ncbi:MAG: uroporphyrinogen decarboxylase family protein [Candidatus Marinimicrobia bacterium]|nr:uroporphyrinogen decarboxylase family protein [Candidatus Neomarinimicrobiota bacterium]
MFSKLHKTNFEDFQKTLFNNKTNSIPLIELGIAPNIREEIAGEPIDTVKKEINFMRSLGYDYIKVQPKIDINMEQNSTSTTNGDSDRAWSAEHSGIITSMKDFENYKWPKKENIDYSRFEKANKLLPDDMGIVGQYGDIYTLTWEMLGFETFSMMMYEDPELVKIVFDKIGDLIISMFENMADMDFVKVLWYSDDIAYSTGLMVNPDFYREMLFPYLKRIGEMAKRRNIPFIYHSDGVLYSVLDELISFGITALHPIEPISMDIKELSEKYGDKLCLCGGVDVDILSRGTTEQVQKLTRDIMKKATANGSWCGGSSNSIPAYCSAKNYLTMVETILTLGGLDG